MKTLEITLQYRNPEMVRRIQKALGIDARKARAHFQDVLRWLWLCGKLREERRSNRWLDEHLPSMRMPGSWLPLDIGWHEFILCTRDYADFCEEYLEGYIHHKPAPIADSMESQGEEFEEQYLGVFFTFCSQHIGTRRLKKWISLFPTWAEQILSKQGA